MVILGWYDKDPNDTGRKIVKKSKAKIVRPSPTEIVDALDVTNLNLKLADEDIERISDLVADKVLERIVIRQGEEDD